MSKRWIIVGVVVFLLLLVGVFFLGRLTAPKNEPTSTTLDAPAGQSQQTTAMPAPTPTAVVQTTASQPAAAPAAPTDPLLPSLQSLGFSSREEVIQYFQMEGVEAREIAACPGEVNCIRILREKDANNYIQPFKMTNPTSMTFDGWRATSQPGINWDGNQAKVPPGTWYVEGITIRPWR
jgi:hypothetical protein